MLTDLYTKHIQHVPKDKKLKKTSIKNKDQIQQYNRGCYINMYLFNLGIQLYNHLIINN